ncbi:MAG: choice-of-anchor L domain-containing protein, partial [Bacteroidota bacterium]
VFGSEEYDEYVCATFNDVFAFFISGPGIVGQQNIALVPGTTTPVAINTVNVGMPGQFGSAGPGCITTNSQYYFQNNAAVTTVQYDGFTTSLVAKSAVMPCSTYHIKLAIADAGDGALDSGVFLEEGGIRCASSFVQVESGLNVPSAGSAVEGCVDGLFTFTREGDTINPATIFYGVAGSATPGVDYAALPGFINFAANSSSTTISVTAFADNLPEGTESIMLILNDTVCNTVVSDTAIIFINDQITADAGPDLTICEGDTIQIGSPAVPTMTYLWSPAQGLNDPTLPDPEVTQPLAGQWMYAVTVTDTNGCTASDTMELTAVPLPTSPFTSPGIICQSDTANIVWTGTAGGGATFNWVFPSGVIQNGTGSGPYDVTWGAAGQYNLSLEITDGSCVSTITNIPIDVTADPQVGLTPTDVTCNGFADGVVAANVNLGTPQFTYQWNAPGNNPSLQGIPAGTYSVTVTDSVGCVDSATVVVSQPAALTNNFTEIAIPCFGATGTITANPNGGTGTYSYLWSNGDVTQSTIVTAGQYTVTITDNTTGVQPCELVDTYVITEPTELMVSASTQIASCGQNNGVATAFASGGTPAYQYSWSNGGTGATISNLAPGPYSVTVTDANNCTATVQVIVDQTPSPSVVAGPDVSFCEGEGGAMITASGQGGTPGYYYQWSCANGPCGLSSVFDNNPNANPASSQYFYVQVTDTNGCLSNIDSVFVEIIPKPIVDAGPDIYICGDSAPCEVLTPTISNSP